LIGRITEIIRTFQPDVVITFGPDGGYGHPDHITVSAATAQAFRLAGNAKEFPEQIAAGLRPHHAARLYFSHFPRSRMLLADRLIKWLVELDKQFHGSVDFAHAVLLFAQESTMLGYSSDYFELAWFPSGFYLVEQGEPATKLYLILSGRVEVIQEKDDGTLHTLAQIEAGNFFGEAGLAYQQPHTAHVVAAENVTCLVFSPQEPSNFAGRGAEAQLRETTAVDLSQPQAHGGATTCIDVSDYVEQKIAAMAAHRTQFSLDPEMFSGSMLRDLFGQEYFVRIHPPIEMETDLFSVSDMLYSRQL
jgi:LmbE family N-acetylglucosaminyl deacetylase